MEVLPKPKDYKPVSIYEDEERLKFIKFKDSYLIDESFSFVCTTPKEDSLQNPPFTITLYLPNQKVFGFGFASEKNFTDWKKQIENLHKKFETSKLSKEQAKGRDGTSFELTPPSTPTSQSLRPEQQLYNNRKKKLSIGPLSSVSISQDLSSPVSSPSSTPKSNLNNSEKPSSSSAGLRRSTLDSSSSVRKNPPSSSNPSSPNDSPSLNRKSGVNNSENLKKSEIPNNSNKKNESDNPNHSTSPQKIESSDNKSSPKKPETIDENTTNTNLENNNSPQPTHTETTPKSKNDKKEKKELKKKEKLLKKEKKKKEKEKKKGGKSKIVSKGTDEEWEKIIQSNLITGPKVKKESK
jgi:hypothetical protein